MTPPPSLKFMGQSSVGITLGPWVEHKELSLMSSASLPSSLLPASDSIALLISRADALIRSLDGNLGDSVLTTSEYSGTDGADCRVLYIQ